MPDDMSSLKRIFMENLRKARKAAEAAMPAEESLSAVMERGIREAAERLPLPATVRHSRRPNRSDVEDFLPSIEQDGERPTVRKLRIRKREDD